MNGLRQPIWILIVLTILGQRSPAQTSLMWPITVENESREVIKIDDVKTLQEDGTLKNWPGVWTFKPGRRANLSVGDKRIEGRQVNYTVKTADGIVSRGWKSLATTQSDDNAIVTVIVDEVLKKVRDSDSARPLTKAEATYRYWNAVHGIVLEENVDAMNNVGFLQFGKVASFVRTMANRIEDQNTSNIDDDAVAAATTYAALLRGLVKLYEGRSGLQLGTMAAELYHLKVDTFNKIRNENQALVAKAEDLFQFLRSRRKALESRYSIDFPPMIPPVSVVLSPFLVHKGYWVMLCNASGDEMKNVRVRYTDADGNAAEQAFADRLTFDPSALFGFTKIDPSPVWRVDRGQAITVICDDWAYTYPTNNLIKN
jgi:hypothetical protein